MRDILLGFRGNISVTANIAPNQMHRMCKYAINGDKKEAEKINQMVDVLHDSLFLESNPIPVKWALNNMNLIEKGIRLPLTWLETKYHKNLDDAIILSRAQEENLSV